jgi:hypothetical protein
MNHEVVGQRKRVLNSLADWIDIGCSGEAFGGLKRELIIRCRHCIDDDLGRLSAAAGKGFAVST